MDGLQSVQNGPVSSTSTDSLSQDQMNMRLILASKDPVAVDAIGSLLTHHDPELIPHLVTLHNDSLGCSDARLIRVVGAKVGDEKKDFEISDTGELSKHSDFEAPDFTIDECYVSGPQLHFSLDVSADVTKVEVMIDSVYLDQIVICGFDNFNLNLDTIEINEESEITVFAYDQYLNYSSQVVSPVTKVPENKVSQGSIFLISISPNPFKSILTFTYRLNNSSEVIISIYDSQGNLVNEIVREQADGTHNVKWNAAGLPAGTYYCRIRAGEDICVSKIVRLK
jgi:hypothetical protein